MSDLGLLLLHLIGDFAAQTDWMSTKHQNRFALLIHCLTYTAIFASGFWLAGVEPTTGLWCSGLIFLSHVVADWRPWTLGSRWHHKAMALDQTAHIGILFLISFYVR
ncbi:MAG: DUF3307 domain-containing protein [Chloroflexota bacterium]